MSLSEITAHQPYIQNNFRERLPAAACYFPTNPPHCKLELPSTSGNELAATTGDCSHQKTVNSGILREAIKRILEWSRLACFPHSSGFQVHTMLSCHNYYPALIHEQWQCEYRISSVLTYAFFHIPLFMFHTSPIRMHLAYWCLMS